MQPLLLSKTTKPPLPANYVARDRLIALIDQGLERKLTLISAPAGFGKTSLVRAWVDHIEIPVCWLTLDEQDNNVGRFFSYFLASLKSINIDIENLHPDPYNVESLTDFKSLLTNIIHLIESSSAYFILVIDDYHLIQNQGIHIALTFLLDFLPTNFRMVIISRADPPLKIAQLRAKGELCELRVNDLRFSDVEADAYLNKKIGLGINLSDIRTLAQKTEGWVVGLQLASLSLSRHPDPAAFVRAFAGNDRFVADYLVDEVLSRQPPDIRLFLLQTSILHQLNAHLCDAVTQRTDSFVILQEFERTNLFLMPLDSQRSWYRYHQLFADLLQVRLRQQYRDDIPHLYRRVSQWYENAQWLSEALKYALLADDAERTARLLEGHILTVASSSELSVLNSQLSQLSSKAINANAWLALAKAWGLAFSGKTDLMRPLLDSAAESLQKLPKKEQIRITGRMDILQSLTHSVKGDNKLGQQLAQKALDELPERDLSMRSFAALLVANNQRFDGRLQDAVLTHQLALRYSRLANDSLLSAIILSRLADMHRTMGQLNQAIRACKQAYEIMEFHQQQTGSTSYILGYVKLRTSVIEYTRNNLDLALQLTEESLPLVRQWGSIDSISLGYFNLTSIALAKDNFIQALSYIQEFMDICPDSNRLHLRIASTLEAAIYLRSGQLAAAILWCDKQELDVGNSIMFQDFTIYHLFAQVLLEQNRLNEAQIIGDKLFSLAHQTGAVFYEINALLVLTLVNSLRDNFEAANNHLYRALSLAAQEGYIRVFLDFGDSMARLIYPLTIDSPYAAFCKQLISHFPAGTQIQHPTQDEFLEPLSSREIEVLILIAEGKSNQEIAQRLHVSLFTVKSHARNIFGKLGVSNRTEAAAKARVLGIL